MATSPTKECEQQVAYPDASLDSGLSVEQQDDFNRLTATIPNDVRGLVDRVRTERNHHRRLSDVDETSHDLGTEALTLTAVLSVNDPNGSSRYHSTGRPIFVPDRPGEVVTHETDEQGAVYTHHPGKASELDEAKSPVAEGRTFTPTGSDRLIGRKISPGVTREFFRAIVRAEETSQPEYSETATAPTDSEYLEAKRELVELRRNIG